jgi:hypothetical protein
MYGKLALPERGYGNAGKRPERRLGGRQNRVAMLPGARFCWRKSGKSLGFGDWSPCKASVRFLDELENSS